MQIELALSPIDLFQIFEDRLCDYLLYYLLKCSAGFGFTLRYFHRLPAVLILLKFFLKQFGWKTLGWIYLYAVLYFYSYRKFFMLQIQDWLHSIFSFLMSWGYVESVETLFINKLTNLLPFKCKIYSIFITQKILFKLDDDPIGSLYRACLFSFWFDSDTNL